MEVLESEQAGVKPVLQIMQRVGQPVGEVDDERLGRRRGGILERVVAGTVVPGAMFGDALTHCAGEIQSAELGVWMFEQLNDTQRVLIVLEAAVVAEAMIEGAFAGVAEWGMPQIVRKCDDFAEFLTQPETPGNDARQMSDFKRVRQA